MSRYPGLPIDLIFVRHGESEGNVADIMHDKDMSYRARLEGKKSYDDRLTERGRMQAMTTGKWLRKNRVVFDAFYYSDLERTKETAALLDLEGAAWVQDTDLREQDLHTVSHSGVSLETARSDAPEHFLNMLRNNHSGGRVIAVCHATIIRSFMLRLENTPYVDFTHADADSLDQTVHNCEIFWYSRRNPYTGEIADRPRWKTRVVSYASVVPRRSSMPWKEIPVEAKSSRDLLAEVEGNNNPLKLTESVAELDEIIPIRASNSAFIGAMI